MKEPKKGSTKSWKNYKPPLILDDIKPDKIKELRLKFNSLLSKLYFKTLACAIIIVPNLIMLYATNILFSQILSVTRPFI